MRILNIGQCGFDGVRLAAFAKDRLDATVIGAEDLADARRRLAVHHFDLVLVNRILSTTGGSGLDVIRSLRGDGIATPLMLVSNYDDAQDAAVALGAIRGFGKDAIDDPATFRMIAEAVRAAQSSAHVSAKPPAKGPAR